MCNQPPFGPWLLQKLGDSEVTGGCAGVFISAGRPKGKSEGESRPGILDQQVGRGGICVPQHIWWSGLLESVLTSKWVAGVEIKAGLSYKHLYPPLLTRSRYL